MGWCCCNARSSVDVSDLYRVRLLSDLRRRPSALWTPLLTQVGIHVSGCRWLGKERATCPLRTSNALSLIFNDVRFMIPSIGPNATYRTPSCCRVLQPETSTLMIDFTPNWVFAHETSGYCCFISLCSSQWQVGFIGTDNVCLLTSSTLNFHSPEAATVRQNAIGFC